MVCHGCSLLMYKTVTTVSSSSYNALFVFYTILFESSYTILFESSYLRHWVQTETESCVKIKCGQQRNVLLTQISYIKLIKKFWKKAKIEYFQKSVSSRGNKLQNYLKYPTWTFCYQFLSYPKIVNCFRMPLSNDHQFLTKSKKMRSIKKYNYKTSKLSWRKVCKTLVTVVNVIIFGWTNTRLWLYALSMKRI